MRSTARMIDLPATALKAVDAAPCQSRPGDQTIDVDVIQNMAPPAGARLPFTQTGRGSAEGLLSLPRKRAQDRNQLLNPCRRWYTLVISRQPSAALSPLVNRCPG